MKSALLLSLLLISVIFIAGCTSSVTLTTNDIQLVSVQAYDTGTSIFVKNLTINVNFPDKTAYLTCNYTVDGTYYNGTINSFSMFPTKVFTGGLWSVNPYLILPEKQNYDIGVCCYVSSLIVSPDHASEIGKYSNNVCVSKNVIPTK